MIKAIVARVRARMKTSDHGALTVELGLFIMLVATVAIGALGYLTTLLQGYLQGTGVTLH
jgi:Flp pilus assembly pilin Flp